MLAKDFLFEFMKAHSECGKNHFDTAKICVGVMFEPGTKHDINTFPSFEIDTIGLLPEDEGEPNPEVGVFLKIIDAPEHGVRCSECGAFAELLQPEIAGSSFHCPKCKTNWCQEC